MPKILFDDEGKAIKDDQNESESVSLEPNELEVRNLNENGDSDASSDSDDEAPEAVSLNAAKAALLDNEKAQREAANWLMAKQEERRRKREEQLKTQKENSKRQKKDLEKKRTLQEQQEETPEEEEEPQEETSQENKDDGRLPADLLAQFSEEQKTEPKRKHLTAEDFERMAEEEAAAEAAKQAKQKRKRTKDERQVGEYTVKVLNKRPKPQPVDKNILSFRESHFARETVPRRDAVLTVSQSRKGAAVVFRRKQH